eukprot:TRINITY_DN2519_c0_g1_i2.p1 TRINITY_DN2519_c0_g1~~TRINITY_DN2519_c0_g1_i2.p1  ORF type:complete len:145 (+),score=47.13 TRINITY_DN2519_c0_g1_i2:35-436(+)
MSENSKVFPLANDRLTSVILDLVQEIANHDKRRKTHYLRRGANEATKSLNKGKPQIVVMAADTEPIEIVLHLPLLCEEKATLYIYVPSKAALGRAAGVSRQVIALSIDNDNDPKFPFADQVDNLKNAIENLFL